MLFGLTMIPAKGDFTQIAVEMLSAHTVENAKLGSFQKSAEGFSGVGVGVSNGILALAVVHP